MDKRAAKRDYKLSHRPMGVFQIRNVTNERVFVASSMNLPGAFNSNRFQLEMGNHRNKMLQADWNELGADKFEFEILEEVPERSDTGYDYKADVEFLEDLWLEKLEPYDDRGYNVRKKTREERLRMIAANRND
ncbi:MAG TPA: GIY-YIG nuclease family protein [Pyrinomonadaceae bacterium]|nr:GIY-YIG nuclease family protein [Pyrinomonadaceae bacterium]